MGPTGVIATCRKLIGQRPDLAFTNLTPNNFSHRLFPIETLSKLHNKRSLPRIRTTRFRIRTCIFLVRWKIFSLIFSIIISVRTRHHFSLSSNPNQTRGFSTRFEDQLFSSMEFVHCHCEFLHSLSLSRNPSFLSL